MWHRSDRSSHFWTEDTLEDLDVESSSASVRIAGADDSDGDSGSSHSGSPRADRGWMDFDHIFEVEQRVINKHFSARVARSSSHFDMNWQLNDAKSSRGLLCTQPVRETTDESSSNPSDGSNGLPPTGTAPSRNWVEPTAPGPRFSVSFSGGGLRAASFQSGVLWRLAASGRLKDVEYLVAVSGGSYIASAFASHVVEAGGPPAGQGAAHINSWYLGVVARTISRMQRNMPYLARDLCKGPCVWPTDGSSCFPRLCDIPILATTIVLNFLVSWGLYVILLVIPIVEVLNFVVGAGMRGAFCLSSSTADETTASDSMWEALVSFLQLRQSDGEGRLETSLSAIAVGVVVAFVLWLLSRKGPGSKSKRNMSQTSARVYCWLGLKSSVFVLVRMVQLSFVLWLLVITSTISELAERQYFTGDLGRVCACRAYVTGYAAVVCKDDWATPGSPLADVLLNYTNCNRASLKPAEAWEQCGGLISRPGSDSPVPWDGPTLCPEGFSCKVHNLYYSQCEPDHHESQVNVLKLSPETFRHPMQNFVLIMPVVLIFSVVLIPIFPGLYKKVLSVCGPLFSFLTAAVLLQLRVFDRLGYSHAHAYQKQHTAPALVLAMVLVPFTHQLKSITHRFYRRSLRRAFYSRGEDRSWSDLALNPYCPFILVNATISSYLRPGDKSPLSDITFSALHMGCEKTGYVKMPEGKSLARTVALSGGAIDAFILGKKDAIQFRFWLEFMSLSMGDWMIFQPSTNRHDAFEEAIVAKSTRLGNVSAQQIGKTAASTMPLRLPTLFVQELIYGFMLFASLQGRQGRCQVSWVGWIVAVSLLVAIVALSFFAFLPKLDCLLHAVLVRSIHQLFNFHHRSPRPPTLVHVTDGGLLDNTGVLQLLRRRRERILLVYGGNDPKEQFKYLKKLADSVAAEHIGSLYDPADPRRDLRETFHNFVEDRQAPYMHLQIVYGWGASSSGEGGRNVGDLIMVMSRLRSKSWRQLQPLLTEEEVFQGGGESDRSDNCGNSCGQIGSDFDDSAAARPDVGDHDHVSQTDLGGCCCDCCHFHGCNCGRKFPNPPNANQCLTPQLFNSLCRLGHEISEEAVQAITSPSPLKPRRAVQAGAAPPPPPQQSMPPASPEGGPPRPPARPPDFSLLAPPRVTVRFADSVTEGV